ncbi:hypothetical protein Adt_18260 [Abeliophyllum distichum]|uniref:Uncharacterized protein n=1 Tax=Abeliophyllum distichum TaxID=126358 RepID=A0ABD1TJN5_9LAMI
MEEKVLRDLEKFKKRAAEKDHDKKKVVAAVQSLLDKAMAASKNKMMRSINFIKRLTSFAKIWRLQGDEAIAGYKMSIEHHSSLHIYGVESFEGCYQYDKRVAG